MTVRDAKGAFPPASGGDDARALYDALTDDLLYDPAVGRATMMGYPCIRLAGRFVASYDAKLGGLVVKLPGERVRQLVDDGTGEPFAPAGKTFREWIVIPTVDRDQWHRLLAEAADFARKESGRVVPRGGRGPSSRSAGP